MSELNDNLQSGEIASARPRLAIKTNLLFAILCALLASLYVGYLLWLASPFFDKISDMPEYVVAGKLYAEGHGSAAYSESEWLQRRTILFPTLRPRGLSMFSPPQSLPFFVALALVPIKYVAAVWLALQVLASALSLFLMKRLFMLNGEQTALLWCAIFFSGPLFEALLIGQLAPFLLLACVYCLISLEKNRALAAAIALSVFILKPQEIATFAVFLLGARKFKTLLYAAGIIGLLSIVSLACAGPEVFTRYFDLMKNLDALSSLMFPQITPTVRGQMLRLGISVSVVAAVSKCLLLTGLLTSLWIGDRLRSSSNWVKLGAQATMPLGLLTAMYVQSYDLLILAPSAVALFAAPAKTWIDRVLLALAAASLCLFIQPIFRFIHYDLKALPVNLHFAALLVFTACCITLAMRHAKPSTTRAVND